MDGALALSVPLNLGQTMHVTPVNGDILIWKALENELIWFEAEFSISDFRIVSSSDLFRAEKLSMILQKARNLNPDFLTAEGAEVINYLEFSRQWGFGSSSTLISNIAAWALVDPFELFFKTSGGSGYDVACARAKGPILYQLKESKPVFEPVAFSPQFRNNLYFVYTGRKKNSDDGIRFYRSLMKPGPVEIAALSYITLHMSLASTLAEFEDYMQEHERIISRFLRIAPIKDQQFSDFDGGLKSLGAWGGDFLLATWEGEPEGLRAYFASKTINLIFRYNDLVL
ncbi:MAG: GYDIA family GHMP kinase [Bacteroidales bacterium]